MFTVEAERRAKHLYIVSSFKRERARDTERTILDERLIVNDDDTEEF